MQTVGIISPGDMGHGLGQVLRAAGLRIVTCVRGRSQRTHALAADAGMETLPELHDVVAAADVFLSLVPPANALSLAREVAGTLGQVRSSLLFADCNSIAPRTVEAISGLINGGGGRFVDVSIIGSPPRVADGRLGRSPQIYASGEGAAEFMYLSEHGLDIRVLEGRQASASSLKMCYAALLKGLTALSTSLMVAGDLLDVRGPLLAQLETTQPELLTMMSRQIPAMPPKARRWVGEMEQMGIAFADVGLSPRIFEGAASLFELVGKTVLGEEMPEARRAGMNMDEVVDIVSSALGIPDEIATSAAYRET